jgi:hypothetical protein
MAVSCGAQAGKTEAGIGGRTRGFVSKVQKGALSLYMVNSSSITVCHCPLSIFCTVQVGC